MHLAIGARRNCMQSGLLKQHKIQNRIIIKYLGNLKFKKNFICGTETQNRTNIHLILEKLIPWTTRNNVIKKLMKS